jgi:hypothetical protein
MMRLETEYAHRVTKAEEMLESFEINPNYPVFLVDIYKQSNDLKVKLCALICLKKYLSDSLLTKKKAFKKAGTRWA